MAGMNSTAQLPPLPVLDGAEVRHWPGHDGYAVSDDGRIFGCRNYGKSRLYRQWRQIAPRLNDHGYLYIGVSINGKRTCRKVHHAVLETFVGPRPTGLEACHENGIRADNHLVNLRWGTRSSNGLDTVRHGHCRVAVVGENAAAARLPDSAVRHIRETAGKIPSWTLAVKYDITQGYVSKIRLGKARRSA